MINKLKILAVIPARGGSKGIPLKNLKMVNNVPLVELAARVAKSVQCIDRIIVSTDNLDIANAAIKGGADAPFMRPEDLSGDFISDFEVLTHALLKIELLDKCKYDVIVMLQPTSPLRLSKHIIETIEKLTKNNFDSVWTISETDSKSHPQKQLIAKNNLLGYYDKKGHEIIARQQLETLYHRNGIAYAISRDCLINKKSIMGKKTGYVICDGNHISIDTEWDLFLVNFIVDNEMIENSS
jgi:CMP-N,N'-diacetyllegionaminic acid synthase